MIKKMVFISGTRADYGKIKPLIKNISKKKKIKIFIFVTGMHLIKKYGYTVNEIKKDFKKNIFSYKNNKENSENYLNTFKNTVDVFGKFINQNKIDAVVIHGDRVESLAAATSAFLSQIKILHIEGGEVSGNIDETIRHSISKLSNTHFVSNKLAFKRLYQMGEKRSQIHIIGSPETDVIFSKKLPSVKKLNKRYDIEFSEYAIVILHPFNEKLDKYKSEVNIFFEAIKKSQKNYVVIYPNNDQGSEIIINKINELGKNKQFKLIRSMRFEYYLTLLKNTNFIIGNSSSGVRESQNYGVPCINVGNRQFKRSNSKNIFNSTFKKNQILNLIKKLSKKRRINSTEKSYRFGIGKSAEKFSKIIMKNKFWEENNQKYFNDII